MSKLTDTQLVILSAAGGREDGAILPLPKSLKLKGGALAKVIDGMIKRNLIEEIPAKPDDQTWRRDDHDRPLTLRITETGLRVIGIEPDDDGPDQAPNKQGRKRPQTASKAFNGGNAGGTSEETVKKPAAASTDVTPKRQTKQDVLLGLLKRKDGVTIPEAMEATGWQAHSIRGAFSTMKKKSDLPISSDKIDGRGRVYRVVAGD